MNEAKAIYEANRAKEILENPTYQWAIESIKEDLWAQFQNSPVRDSEARERIYMMMWATKKLQQVLQTTYETGKLTQIELEHKKKLLERVNFGM